MVYSLHVCLCADFFNFYAAKLFVCEKLFCDCVMKMEVSKSKKTEHKDENENSRRHISEENIERSTEIDIDRISKSSGRVNIFLMVCIIGVSLAILMEIINAQNRNKNTKGYAEKRKYWVYSAYNDVNNENGLLKHIHSVLRRLGYEKSSNETAWTLLWSHDYPFRVLYPNLHRLKPHQRVNHFPGTGFITNKVDLATSDSKYIPRAFKLPKSKLDFLKYASEHKKALFLEKHNQHRGVYLKNVSEIDLASGESFVQEYVQKPFLVDGHKFDIGVYVVVTSVNPLRVYWYKGDVLFRYCPAKYYPFDPRNLDKYVIGDDYLPTWEVPSLSHPYVALGASMKDAFDIYAQSKGKDTLRMWDEVQKAIADIILKKEHHIIEALENYPSQENFFEMMRFDLVLDEDFKVYLLEANMSPNLSSAHFPPNQLLYEQVLYNLFGITGVGSQVIESDQKSKDMVAAQKNIAVWSLECSTTCKEQCDDDICGLCKPCIDGRLRSSLLRAHREFIHRGDFRRLFPPPMKQGSLDGAKLINLTKYNKLQYLWYQGKCNTDITWCS